MPQSIKRIRVDDLFGIYSYELDASQLQERSSRLITLYGDNGSGKTTILKLAFHMLAHTEQAGHKSFVAQTRFRTFQVELDDKSIVTAHRDGPELVGTFRLTVHRPGEPTIGELFIANPDNTLSRRENYPNISQALSDLSLSLFLLPDDRRLRATEDIYDEPFWEAELTPRRIHSNPQRAREFRDIERTRLVTASISQFELVIRSLTLQASSRGQENSDNVYTEVLKRVNSSRSDESTKSEYRFEVLCKSIEELGKKTADFSKFGLSPPFKSSQLLDLLRDTPPESRGLVADILDPYIDSHEERLRALGPAQGLLDRFTSSINRFYDNKQVLFDIRGGLLVELEDGDELDSTLLSSGERQILILLCTCASAPPRSVFIIDEPELSLNIKWQRILTDALLACTEHSDVQFILATHSFEIMARQRGSIIQLVEVEP